MNRRQFLGLSATTVAAAALVYAERKIMVVGEILRKLAEGAALTPEEKVFLSGWGNASQQTNAIVSGWGGENPSFSSMYAETAEFGTLPMSYCRVTRSTDYSINNDTLTNIPFTSSQNGKYIKLDTTNTDRIYVYIPQRARAIAMVGSVRFASNATGRRSAGYEAFDAGDVSLGGRTFFSQLPTGIAADTYALSEAAQFTAGTAYIKFNALQTSGGALNVEFYRVGLYFVG